MTAMGNTALFMAVSVPVILALSLLISVYIYENPRLAGCLKTSFLIPMAIPVTSVVLMWRFLFDDNGIINGVLNACGMGYGKLDEYRSGFLDIGSQLRLEESGVQT